MALPLKAAPRAWALLVIDMQNDFCHAEGYVEQVVGKDASPCRAIVPDVNALVALAREASVPVIWVAATYDPDAIPATMRDRQLRLSPEVCCAAGSWGAEFFGLTPVEGDTVLWKHTYSAFLDTSLEDRLRDAGVTDLLVAGVQTNVCIDHTVRDAFARGFRCTLVRDCLASHSPALHDASLQTLGLLYADIVALSDLSPSALADRAA